MKNDKLQQETYEVHLDAAADGSDCAVAVHKGNNGADHSIGQIGHAFSLERN